jgi:hypothetical protein
MFDLIRPDSRRMTLNHANGQMEKCPLNIHSYDFHKNCGRSCLLSSQIVAPCVLANHHAESVIRLCALAWRDSGMKSGPSVHAVSGGPGSQHNGRSFSRPRRSCGSNRFESRKDCSVRGEVMPKSCLSHPLAADKE